MNTKHFEYIIVIAETKNLSHASRRLGVSQPVLSRYLSNLERQLEIKLFIRENRQLYITAAGQIYLNGVRRMKDLQTQMIRSFDSLQGRAELTLTLGMSPFQGGKELASFYPKLLDRYPNLNLVVSEGDSKSLLDKLYRKEITALLNLYNVNLMPNTKIATLIKAEVLIAIPNYHPLSRFGSSSAATPTPLTVQQLFCLNDIPFVYLNSNSILGQLAEQACMRYGFTPQVLLRTGNTIAVTSLLATGSYAGFLLQSSAEKMSNLTFFQFPHPLYLYSGLIFLNEYQPNEIEQYLFWLEYQQVKCTTPNMLYVNDYGQSLLNLISHI